MVQVLFTELTKPLSEGCYQFHLNSLPLPIRKKIERLQRAEDAQNSLVGKLLLRMGLKNYNDRTAGHFQSSDSPFDGPSGVLSELQYTKYNRPYLPDSYVDFNITHSGQLVACVIAQDCQVGIDVEKIQPVDYSEFQDVFSGDEMDRIKQSTDPQRKFWFFWTVKEAVAKAQGIGLGIPLTKVAIEDGESYAKVFTKTWFLRSLQLWDGYCACVATDQAFDDCTFLVEQVPPDTFEAAAAMSLNQHGA